VENFAVGQNIPVRVPDELVHPDVMAAAGYPWTVIPLAERKTYMAALERASVEENIGRFAAFLAKLVRDRLTGSPLPEILAP